MTDPELAAMEQVHTALLALDEGSRLRVLRWAAEKYDVAAAPAARSGVIDNAGESAAESPAFNDLADLVHAAGPSSGPQRALVVAYWFQEIEGRDGWGGGDLNSALKNLGTGLANVTNTLDSLQARKPALVMQIAKSGRSRQARKTYKLTAAGVREVRDMITRTDSADAA